MKGCVLDASSWSIIRFRWGVSNDSGLEDIFVLKLI